MRSIIVSDVRFQILCKSCMVLIKTPIVHGSNEQFKTVKEYHDLWQQIISRR
jgi:hypothetical protein